MEPKIEVIANTTKEVCPTCGHDQFMIVRDMTSRRIGKCGHEWPCPEQRPQYQCNCGLVFDHPMARTAHSATCPVMSKLDCRRWWILGDVAFTWFNPEAVPVIALSAYEALEKENAKLKAALNKIGILGMGGDAYTSDFTEKVNMIVRSVLEEK